MSGQTTPVQLYGVHSVTPYSRVDGTFYGMIRCLESASISLAAQQNKLYAGSNKYPWASETGQITSEMSLKFAEYPDFLYTVFLGKAPTPTAAETSGNIVALVNVKGTSVQAATGLASVTVLTASKANLKFGKYVVVAKDATHIDIYLATDVDITRGTADTFADDTLKSTAGTNLAIATTVALDVATLGITVTGGASATAFVAGDTAVFYVRPVNSVSSVVRVGGSSDVFPEFGAIVVAQHRSSDEMFEIEAFRCKGSGMPFPFDMFAWAKSDVKVDLLYDSAKNGVFDRVFVRV